MLSYQHMYHAGNLADVHKHAVLCWILSYLTRKDKPVSYIETHAGRGHYDLSSLAAAKTGEAAAGIARLLPHLPAEHPYVQAIAKHRTQHGADTYPGSPALAASLLRPTDQLHLAELHPTEYAELRQNMARPGAKCHQQDGFELAYALCPPTPRRGIMVIDPSYEVKTDYAVLPGHLTKIAKVWNVGILVLWYPILRNHAQQDMAAALTDRFPEALRHEVTFPAARKEHGMIGSGVFVVNPPYGLAEETARITDIFAAA